MWKEFCSISDGPSVPRRTSGGRSPRPWPNRAAGPHHGASSLGDPGASGGRHCSQVLLWGQDALPGSNVQFPAAKPPSGPDPACDTREPLPPSAPQAHTGPLLQPRPGGWHAPGDRASVARLAGGTRPGTARQWHAHPPTGRQQPCPCFSPPRAQRRGQGAPLAGQGRQRCYFGGNQDFSQEKGVPGAGPLLPNALPGRGHCRAPLGQRTQENYEKLKGGREAGVRGGPLPTLPSPRLRSVLCAP